LSRHLWLAGILLLFGGCASSLRQVRYLPSAGSGSSIPVWATVDVQLPLDRLPRNVNWEGLRQNIIRDVETNVFPGAPNSAPKVFLRLNFDEVKLTHNRTVTALLTGLALVPLVSASYAVSQNKNDVAVALLGASVLLDVLAFAVKGDRLDYRARLTADLATMNGVPIGRYVSTETVTENYSRFNSGQENTSLALLFKNSVEKVKQQILADRPAIEAAVAGRAPVAGTSQTPVEPPAAIELKKTAPAKPQVPPSLSFATALSDGDADRILEGSEKVALSVQVTNRGQGAASGVSVELSGTSKALTYLGTEQSLGDIAPGESAVAVFERVLPNDVPADEGTIIIRVAEANGYNALEEKELHVAMQPAKVKREVEYVSGLVDVDQPFAASSYRQSDAYAVIVGVSNYATTGIPLVKYAVRDAESVKDYLVGVCGVPEQNIRMVTDAQATGKKVEALITDWLGRNVTKPGQSVYVYFAGHGTPSPDKGDAYLVPYDGDPELPSTLYSVSSFYAALRKLASDNIIVALDACFSGAGGRSVIAQGKRPIVAVKMPETDQKLAVLTASAATEISQDYDAKRHGLFTYWMLKALRGEADADNDGWVTLGELYSYIKPHVEEESRKMGYSQSPQLIEPSTDKKNTRIAMVSGR
jgi:hypothetical protein